jgi:Plasmid pRiA4b ORF-3-like protein
MRDPAEVTVELLAAFGAVTGTSKRRITPLGQWALSTIDSQVESLLDESDDVDEDGAYQLKIVLRHVRPACWRRVVMAASATLGEWGEVIQVAFEWGGDHLHGFTLGRRRYGDPYFEFEYDEYETSLAAVFAQTRKPITYTYDFGDDCSTRSLWRRSSNRSPPIRSVSAAAATHRSRTVTSPPGPPSTKLASTPVSLGGEGLSKTRRSSCGRTSR